MKIKKIYRNRNKVANIVIGSFLISTFIFSPFASAMASEQINSVSVETPVVADNSIETSVEIPVISDDVVSISTDVTPIEQDLALSSDVSVEPVSTNVLPSVGNNSNSGGSYSSTLQAQNGILTATITATPAQIVVGGSSTLTWSSENAVNCTSNNFSTGGVINGNAIVTPALAVNESFTYYVTCFDINGSFVNASATITAVNNPVNQNAVAIITATPSQIYPGESSTLTWSSENAVTCTSHNFNTNGTLSGSAVVSPSLAINESFTYYVTCFDISGAFVNASATITAVDPSTVLQPIANITATPSQIPVGGSSTLTWSSTHATTCTSNNFETNGATSGSIVVSPSLADDQSFAYYVTCFNAAGMFVNSFATITADSGLNSLLPTVIFFAYPSEISVGQSTGLVWLSKNAITCTSNNFDTGGEYDGSAVVTPSLNVGESFTYYVTCFNTAGDFVNASTVVTAVNDNNTPVVNLRANPTEITVGESSILSWTSRNVTSCTSDGFDINNATNGMLVITPVNSAVGDTFTYHIDCTNASGVIVTSSATITVIPNNSVVIATPIDPVQTNPLIPILTFPSPVVTLTATPSQITVGGSSTLTWNSRNAVSCSSGDFNTGGAISGSVSVTPALNVGASITYNITCLNVIGVFVNASATITAVSNNGSNVPTVVLTATPSQITVGGSSILTWRSEHSTVCSSQNFNTNNSLNGNITVIPSTNTPGTYTYSITCLNDAGDFGIASVVITVISGNSISVTPVPPVLVEPINGGGNNLSVTLTANPSTVPVGSNSVLNWTSSHVTSCTSNDFVTGGSVNGSVIVNLANSVDGDTFTYTITCVNTAGVTVTSSATVIVLDSGNGGGRNNPTVTLVANPTEIQSGGSSTLTWTSQNTTSCNGTGFSTSGTINGSVALTITGSVGDTSTYTVNCVNSVGTSVSAQAMITIVSESGNNNGGGGNGGGGSSGGGGSRRAGQVLGASISTNESCDYLHDFLRIDWTNNPDEVTKVQSFLKQFENIDVDVTGIFDQKTFDAVSIFQERYKADILTPWGHDYATGFVYILTKNKINEIYCQKEIPLSSADKIEIENFRNFILSSLGLNSNTSLSNSIGRTQSASTSIWGITAERVNASTDTEGENIDVDLVKDTTDDEVESQATSTGFWNFVKGLFR